MRIMIIHLSILSSEYYLSTIPLSSSKDHIVILLPRKPPNICTYITSLQVYNLFRPVHWKVLRFLRWPGWVRRPQSRTNRPGHQQWTLAPLLVNCRIDPCTVERHTHTHIHTVRNSTTFLTVYIIRFPSRQCQEICTVGDVVSRIRKQLVTAVFLLNCREIYSKSTCSQTVYFLRTFFKKFSISQVHRKLFIKGIVSRDSRPNLFSSPNSLDPKLTLAISDGLFAFDTTESKLNCVY